MADRGRSVVIVDDEDDIRQMVRLTLQARGFVVVGEAGNGLEAVSVVLREQPDAIILDQRMPGHSGEDSAEMLRNAAPGAVIVAFSAFLDDVPEWADSFLAKEQIVDLPRKLSSLLENRVGL